MDLNSDRPYALTARVVFPVVSDPLPGGVVTISGERIVAVGENTSGRPPIDLGSVALLPGLVNAHTHLEFSDLQRPLGAAGMSFPDWIRAVVQGRRESDPTELLARQQAAVRTGSDESRAVGVTTLGNIASPAVADDYPHLSPAESPPRVTVFRELIGLAADRVEPLAAEAAQWISRATSDDAARRPAVSPHAPYSVHPELLRRVCDLSAHKRFPVAMHLAESIEELELLRSHSGPLHTLLADLDAWHPAAIPRGIEPLAYLEQLARADRALVIHGNFLTAAEIQFLAARAEQMSVVYCPRTHAYFDHGEYPLAEMLAAGVNVALGTDSRASSPDLNLFEEMRFAADRHPAVPLGDIMRIGTAAGARALGWHNTVGALRPGLQADLVSVALPDESQRDDPYERLFAASAPPRWAVMRGSIVPPK